MELPFVYESIYTRHTMQRVVDMSIPQRDSLFCMPSDVILFSFLFDLPLFSQTRPDTMAYKKEAPAMASVYVVGDIGFDHSHPFEVVAMEVIKRNYLRCDIHLFGSVKKFIENVYVLGYGQRLTVG